jgi:hypothetical protein
MDVEAGEGKLAAAIARVEGLGVGEGEALLWRAVLLEQLHLVGFCFGFQKTFTQGQLLCTNEGMKYNNSPSH